MRSDWLCFRIRGLPRPLPVGTATAADLVLLAGWPTLLTLVSAHPHFREVTSLTPIQIDDMDPAHLGIATRTNAYFRVWMRGVSAADQVAFKIALESHPGVDAAWWDLVAEVASAPPGSLADGDGVLQPGERCQEHLGPAPLGVDALWAWGTATGARVQVADVEWSWTQHTDVRPIARAMLLPTDPGFVNLAASPHGVRSVGTCLGRTPRVGCMGVAPDAHLAAMVTTARILNTVTPPVATKELVANAIYTARFKLQGAKGPSKLGLSGVQVLLLEVQRGGAPTERMPQDFAAIWNATRRDVVVVEPAGNGGVDLATLQDPTGTLRWASPGLTDSGAVVVGARDPQTLDVVGNWGERVDCWSWGRGVVAPSGNMRWPTHGPNTYTRFFGGTSAAAAIIAGTSAILIEQAQSRLGLRDRLRAQSKGTLGPPGSPELGPQPDLRRHLISMGAPHPEVHGVVYRDQLKGKPRRLHSLRSDLATGGPGHVLVELEGPAILRVYAWPVGPRPSALTHVATRTLRGSRRRVAILPWTPPAPGGWCLVATVGPPGQQPAAPDRIPGWELVRAARHSSWMAVGASLPQSPGPLHVPVDSELVFRGAPARLSGHTVAPNVPVRVLAGAHGLKILGPGPTSVHLLEAGRWTGSVHYT